MCRRKKGIPVYHSFRYIIWGLRIIDNVMKHFLALLSMLSDLDPAYHLINPRTSTYKCIYVLFFLK